MTYDRNNVNVQNIDFDTILVYITLSMGVGGLEINMIVFYSTFFLINH